MKFSKVMALAGVTLLASGVLAACSGSGSSAKGEKTFSYVYETDKTQVPIGCTQIY